MVQGEYKLGRCSRRCSVEDRPLVPGEAYFSVVEYTPNHDDEESLARRDISAHAWQGPPEGTLGWWKNRMPEAGAKKMKLAPDAVLVDLMRRSQELEQATTLDPEEPQTNDGAAIQGRGPLMFLFALMLMRRRLIHAIDPPADAVEENRLWFEFSDDGSIFSVPQCRISQTDAQRLGDSLVDLLYCETE
jgi:hypothetical protein